MRAFQIHIHGSVKDPAYQPVLVLNHDPYSCMVTNFFFIEKADCTVYPLSMIKMIPYFTSKSRSSADALTPLLPSLHLPITPASTAHAYQLSHTFFASSTILPLTPPCRPQTHTLRAIPPVPQARTTSPPPPQCRHLYHSRNKSEGYVPTKELSEPSYNQRHTS